MYRYFISLSYSGTNFHGWQIQENAVTVQQEVEYCMKLLLHQTIALCGCGRTDTGVHARFYVAHVDLKRKIMQNEIPELIRKLNLFLSESIVIREIIPVCENIHARFDAETRTYKYFISQTKNPFLSKYAYYYHGQLNVHLMNLAAMTLKNYSDFTAFAKVGGNNKTNDCKIYNAEWKIDENSQLLIFTITANRFLRNMVRAIVGTLLEVGKGKMTIHEFRTIIEEKKKNSAGASVDAKGLFLWDIKYPEKIKFEKKNTTISLETPIFELLQ